MSLLEVSAWTGVLAAVLLTYRILGTWQFTSALTKAVAVTLLAVIVGQAYGSSATIRAGTSASLPDDAVQIIFACRLAVVALCLFWPWRE